MAPEHCKMICKTLRFLAHTNGATLLFTATADEHLMASARSLLSSYAFRTSHTQRLAFDHSKPVSVPCGSDSLTQIGAPPLTAEAMAQLRARDPTELWQHAYHEYFPDTGVGQRSVPADPTADFREAAVDAMRAAKDEELARYRKRADRRAKELAAKHSKSRRKSRRSVVE